LRGLELRPERASQDRLRYFPKIGLELVDTSRASASRPTRE
jgi:hypothetical protein